MTEWGPPIEVNGERPGWLSNNVYMRWHSKTDFLGVWHDGISDLVSWAMVIAIRLPADHTAYGAMVTPAPNG